ncbi:hypothetical protein AAF712_008998 [Marasmius tenuissimus]|uniref:Uncharacterized protein n=1 Tax=Marasmius tenuissimus TaxID=585030 RepID=A0ABR2ZUN9_9AGAR
MILNTRKATDPEYNLTISSRRSLAFTTIPPSAEVEEQEEHTTEPSPEALVKKVDPESYSYGGTHITVTFRDLSAEAGASERSMTETSLSDTIFGVNDSQKGGLGDEIGDFHNCDIQTDGAKADPTCVWLGTLRAV